MTPLYLACWRGHLNAARLGLIMATATNHGDSPYMAALNNGHVATADWLSRIQACGGWTRYLYPRYKLVVLRDAVARGLARRERAFDGKELVLDFLFPSDQPSNPGDGAVDALMAQDGTDWGAHEVKIRKMVRRGRRVAAASKQARKSTPAGRALRNHRPLLLGRPCL
mmetsp:Transcript_13528/g.41792  ORF Transcript_13528/g.41792 Transcript_13528/m.41792 type:complete len:168 (-) Transcript_13528:132-635(-)